MKVDEKASTESTSQTNMDIRLERIRQESVQTNMDFYQSIMKRNSKEKRFVTSDPEDRLDLQKALNIIRNHEDADSDVFTLINDIKNLASSLNCVFNELGEGVFELKNKKLYIQIKIADRSVTDCSISHHNDEAVDCDVFKVLLVKGYVTELASSISLLNSFIPERANNSQILKILSNLESNILELEDKDATNSFECGNDFYYFARTPVNAFSIVLFCEPYFFKLLKASNDSIVQFGKDLHSAVLLVRETNTLNSFPTESFLDSNTKDWYNQNDVKADNFVTLPYEFVFRFSRPIVMMRFILDAIESCGDFKCNVLNKANFSQHISGCFMNEVKLKFETGGGNIIQLYEFRKFGSCDDDDVVVDEISFLHPHGLLEPVRHGLIGFSLSPEDRNLLTASLEQSSKYSKANEKTAVVARIRLIPMLVLYKLGFIVAFKIGGITLSAKVSVHKGALIFDIMSMDKTFKPSSSCITKWSDSINKSQSIPFVVRMIISDIQKKINSFGSTFSTPLLPILDSNVELKRSLNQFTTVPKKEEPLMSGFGENRRVHGSSTFEGDMDDYTEDAMEEMRCEYDFLTDCFEELCFLNEFTETNVGKIGESWLGLVRIFFTCNYMLHALHSSNTANGTQNGDDESIKKILKEDEIYQVLNRKSLCDVQKNYSLAILNFKSKRVKYEKYKRDSMEIQFRVKREANSGPSLLRSMKYFEEVDELVPRRPPYQNDVPFQPHHYHHYLHHHYMAGHHLPYQNFAHNPHLHHHAYLQHGQNSSQQSQLPNNFYQTQQQMFRGGPFMHGPNESGLQNTAINRNLPLDMSTRNSGETPNLRQVRSNTDSSATTMTLNNAFNDLEALAAMGRDDAESVTGDSSRIGTENVSPSSGCSFKELPPDHRARLQQQQSLGSLSQLSPMEDPKMNPNIARLRLMQQHNLSGGEVFDFVTEDTNSTSGNTPSRQLTATESLSPYEEGFSASPSGRSSVASNSSRRGTARNGSGNNRPVSSGNGGTKTISAGSSMELDSMPGTPTPTRKPRKPRKLSNVSLEQQQAFRKQQNFINPYMAASNKNAIPLMQGPYPTEDLASTVAESPSEESRRMYEMEMLGDSSDDEETDPPPPRPLDQQAQTSYLTPQQLQQRSQRAAAAAAAEQQRKLSAQSTTSLSVNSVLTSSSNSLQSKSSFLPSLNEAKPTRNIPDDENPTQKLSLSIKMSDKSKKSSTSPSTPVEDLQRLPSLQKSSVSGFPFGTTFSVQKQSLQLKKETPPVLDLYDAELESELKMDKDLSPRSSLQFSRERSSKNLGTTKDTALGNSSSMNPVRQKDPLAKSAIAKGNRKTSSSHSAGVSGLSGTKRENSAKAGESGGTESLKFVLKIPKATTNGSKSNQYSSSSSPSSTSSSSTMPTSSGSTFATTPSVQSSSSTTINASGVSGIAEPVARLSSHAAPPSKSKSMHSRMFSDSAHRYASSQQPLGLNRKRPNPSSSNTNPKKRSKDSTNLNKNLSGSSTSLTSSESGLPPKSTKRGSISTSLGNSLASSTSLSSSSGNVGTGTSSNANSNTTLSTSGSDVAAIPQVSFFPGLRNFKIPKVVETTADTNTTTTVSSINDNQTTNKQDSTTMSSSSSTGGPPSSTPSSLFRGSDSTASLSGRSNYNRNSGNGPSGSSSTSETSLFPGADTSGSNSINIQQQLQRRPNKSILKNSSYNSSDGNPRSSNLPHSSGGYRSSSNNSSGKSRKTLLPNQNMRMQSSMPSQSRPPMSGGNYMKGEKSGWQNRDRTAPPIDWAPAFSHHQQMASQQQMQSSLFHSGSNNPSGGGGGYGLPPPLLPFSQQPSHQNTLNSNANPPTLQQQQQHSQSQRPESDGDPLSPVEGLLIDEDE